LLYAPAVNELGAGSGSAVAIVKVALTFVATPAGFKLADGHSRKTQAWRGLAQFRE
jgi:hypothetical protein